MMDEDADGDDGDDDDVGDDGDDEDGGGQVWQALQRSIRTITSTSICHPSLLADE